MLLVLKILLAVASYVFICFTKRNKWARILSICTGASLILWMIIPNISSEIPKMSALWKNVLLATAFIFGYMLVCFLMSYFNSDYEVLYQKSLIGLRISFISVCVVGIIYSNIYNSNIERVTQIETSTVSSVNLASTDAVSELSKKIKGRYVLYSESKESIIDGKMNTEEIMKYWYYASDGGVKPGIVSKDSIKVYFIGKNETPHMNTVVKTTQLIVNNYNRLLSYTYEKQEIDRTYAFYVPKGSILELVDSNE